MKLIQLDALNKKLYFDRFFNVGVQEIILKDETCLLLQNDDGSLKVCIPITEKNASCFYVFFFDYVKEKISGYGTLPIKEYVYILGKCDGCYDGSASSRMMIEASIRCKDVFEKKPIDVSSPNMEVFLYKADLAYLDAKGE